MRHYCFVLVIALTACSSDSDDAANANSGNSGTTPANVTTELDADQTDSDTSGPPEFESRQAPGRWFGGDLHVHATGASNDTGGDSFPPRIKEVAVERGLSWLVLTDHSNSTGSDPSTRDEDPNLFNMGPEFPYWETAAELTDEEFLFIDGNEISPVDENEIGPTGHVGCAPRDLDTFDTEYVFTDRPRGTVTGGETLEQAAEAGCFATLNHPYALASWTAFDWTSTDYDAVEVYNGTAGWDQGDFDALEAWACDITLGRNPTAVGGSDNHRIEIAPPGGLTNPPLAWPTTWAWADGLTWPNIVDALESGRVSVTDDGEPLELDVYDSDGAWLGMMGDEIDAGGVAWARVKGSVSSQGKARVARLYKLTAGACDDPRGPRVREVPDPQWQVVWETELDDGESFEESIALEPTAGDAYFLYKGPSSDRGLGDYGVGFTNAVRLVAEVE